MITIRVQLDGKEECLPNSGAEKERYQRRFYPLQHAGSTVVEQILNQKTLRIVAHLPPSEHRSECFSPWIQTQDFNEIDFSLRIIESN